MKPETRPAFFPVLETLDIAARSRVWIGVLHLFGFNVFRNPYKPLLAATTTRTRELRPLDGTPAHDSRQPASPHRNILPPA